MNITKSFIVLGLLIALLSGCNDDVKTTPTAPVAKSETSTSTPNMPAPSTPQPVDEVAHTARNTLDWSGTYQGVTPCAECEGIKSTLQLNQDGTYILSKQYLGGLNDKLINSNGVFSWNKAGNTITLSDQQGANQYFVGENVLFVLDKSGQRISGALANHYRLAKLAPEYALTQINVQSETKSQTAALQGRRWELVELMGKKIPAYFDHDSRPYIEFATEGDRIHGFSGCNQFNGGFMLNARASRINFTQMGMTRMSCMDTEFEQPLLQVLALADNYKLSDDTLTLYKAQMAPLAVFKAIPVAQ